MGENDRSLLAKARVGDIEAFEELIESYRKKVFNIALRMVGNREDASDLAQEVFIRIFKSLKSFKEESQFSTWVYRITTNVCLDHIRKNKKTNNVSLEEEIELSENSVKKQYSDASPSPDIIAERNEVRRIISSAVRLLPEDHRSVIVLRDIQGFSYEEISKILNCPEGTVKSRLNRARQILRERLGDKLLEIKAI